MGRIAVVVTLLALLALALAFAVYSWNAIEGPPMPTTGYVAMALGVVFSLVIGFGLMALVFYSSRRGYDARAQEHHDERH
jgi:TRAP-type C4-dicarboxylate transport system permease small subunit